MLTLDIKLNILKEFQNNPKYRNGYYQELGDKYGMTRNAISKMARKYRNGFYDNFMKCDEQNIPPILDFGEEFSKPRVECSNKTDDASILYNGDEMVVKKTWTTPPSPEEIIRYHKIDTAKWRLGQLWVKEKQESFITSASFLPIADKTFCGLTKDDIETVIQDVISQNVSFGGMEGCCEPVISGDEDRALFVYLSDKHFGAWTLENTIYPNHYDQEVVRDRMLSVIREIQDLQNRFGAFDRICVFDLGDSVDGWNGETVRGGHKLPQKMTNKETFNTYFTVHKEFFDSLMKFYSGDVEFRVMTEDNHGGDFGYICNKSLEQYLTTRYKNISVVLEDKFITHFDYGNHTFLITHGKDSLDMKRGFPLMLNDKTESLILKYLIENKITNTNIHFVKGDLHQNSSQLTSAFRYRNVLSLYGMSRWSATNFGPNKAGCSFDIVEKETSKIYESYILF